MNPQPLRPTLWRTARVLANVTRLRLFAELLRQQPQTVLQLGESLALTQPVASQGLRGLEARGLLKARRVRRYVEYRIPNTEEAGALAELVDAFLKTLQNDARPIEKIIELATGFTHPTRIEVYRCLHTEPLSPAQLRPRLGISWPALSRHLIKLLRRGYVVVGESDGRYTIKPHPHSLGRALAGLALA
ncbi:MAG TPA: helix-turn-helix domain-containing protein [Verrucomicrobiae bacterium]